MKLLPPLFRDKDLFLAETGAGGFFNVFLEGFCCYFSLNLLGLAPLELKLL